MGIKNPGQFSALPDVQVIVKTADETVNNSNVPQDDDELAILLKPNELWYFQLLLLTQQDNAAADYTFAWAAPAGSDGRWQIETAGIGSDNSFAGNTGFADASTAIVMARIIGYIVNGATAGELRFKWSQSNATLSDNKILAKSHIRAIRLA